MNKGDYLVVQGHADSALNDQLLRQFLAAENLPNVKKTHLFNGRYENIYLTEKQLPALAELKAEARMHAENLLGRPVQKMGCWCNAMGPGAQTTLHSHDDDDEALSGVYYVRVPQHSGNLILHQNDREVEHDSRAGQWVFFSPRTPHAVGKNCSNTLRLSIAFNFS